MMAHMAMHGLSCALSQYNDHGAAIWRMTKTSNQADERYKLIRAKQRIQPRLQPGWSEAIMAEGPDPTTEPHPDDNWKMRRKTV